jgi:hypothetical protein
VVPFGRSRLVELAAAAQVLDDLRRGGLRGKAVIRL